MLKMALKVDAGAARGIAEHMAPDRLERVLIKAVQKAMGPVISAVRARAPIGKTSVKKRHLAGMLARSIAFRVRTQHGPLRMAITAAPHGHLVERGHRLVRGGQVTRLNRGTGKRSTVKLVDGVLTGKRGGRYTGRVIGQVKKHPFVKPVVDDALPEIEQTIKDEIERALLLAARIGRATGRGL